MDQDEREMRRQFFEETGKTPEQEAQDSEDMLGMCLLIVVAIFSGLIAWGLIVYFW